MKLYRIALYIAQVLADIRFNIRSVFQLNDFGRVMGMILAELLPLNKKCAFFSLPASQKFG
jgi:hypothetical protein